MHEIRCFKCHKVIGKSDTYKGHLIGGKIMTHDQKPVEATLKVGVDKIVDIKCPHNYRENEKNVQCKTMNSVVV